jgi:hypothetical protein
MVGLTECLVTSLPDSLCHHRIGWSAVKGVSRDQKLELPQNPISLQG